MAYKLRILHLSKVLCTRGKKEHVTETLCGPQSLKYLLSGPLPKRLADPGLDLKMSVKV